MVSFLILENGVVCMVIIKLLVSIAILAVSLTKAEALSIPRLAIIRQNGEVRWMISDAIYESKESAKEILNRLIKLDSEVYIYLYADDDVLISSLKEALDYLTDVGYKNVIFYGIEGSLGVAYERKLKNEISDQTISEESSLNIFTNRKTWKIRDVPEL